MGVFKFMVTIPQVGVLVPPGPQTLPPNLERLRGTFRVGKKNKTKQRDSAPLAFRSRFRSSSSAVRWSFMYFVLWMSSFSSSSSGSLPSFSRMTRSFLSTPAKTWSSSFSFSFRREISALQPMSLFWVGSALPHTTHARADTRKNIKPRQVERRYIYFLLYAYAISLDVLMMYMIRNPTLMKQKQRTVRPVLLQ